MNFSSLEMVNYYQLSKVARLYRAPKLIGEELLIPTIAGVRLQSLVNTSGGKNDDDPHLQSLLLRDQPRFSVCAKKWINFIQFHPNSRLSLDNPSVASQEIHNLTNFSSASIPVMCQYRHVVIFITLLPVTHDKPQHMSGLSNSPTNV